MAERSVNGWSTLSVDARTELIVASPATRISFIKKIANLDKSEGMVIAFCSIDFILTNFFK